MIKREELDRLLSVLDPDRARAAEESDPRLEILRNALNELTPAERTLFLTYFHGGKTSYQSRKAQAESLGIRLIVLRIRAHRIRIKLKKLAGVATASRFLKSK